MLYVLVKTLPWSAPMLARAFFEAGYPSRSTVATSLQTVHR